MRRGEERRGEERRGEVRRGEERREEEGYRFASNEGINKQRPTTAPATSITRTNENEQQHLGVRKRGTGRCGEERAVKGQGEGGGKESKVPTTSRAWYASLRASARPQPPPPRHDAESRANKSKTQCMPEQRQEQVQMRASTATREEASLAEQGQNICTWRVSEREDKEGAG